MTRHLKILLAALVTAAVSVSCPALAVGNSLLSGYGGPGQGSQAILGSTLIGGGSGGGGGGSGGSGSGGSTDEGGAGGSSGSLHLGERPGAAGSSTDSESGARAGHGGAGSGSGRATSAGGASGSRVGTGRTSAGGAGTYPTLAAQAADAGESQALGLSGDDLLYVVLALAALAFTGVLTRRLSRTEGPESNIR